MAFLVYTLVFPLISLFRFELHGSTKRHLLFALNHMERTSYGAYGLPCISCKMSEHQLCNIPSGENRNSGAVVGTLVCHLADWLQLDPTNQRVNDGGGCKRILNLISQQL